MAFGPASALVVVCGFSAGALVSRQLESLPLKNGLFSALLICLVVWVLAFAAWLILAAIVSFSAFLKPGMRVPTAVAIAGSGAAVLGGGVGLALSPACMHRLGYSDERAVEELITRFHPVARAIRSFEADHDRPPQALVELVPHYLPRIPRPEVLDTPIELRYDRLEQDWRLQADAYLMHGLASAMPLANVVYLGSQDYERGHGLEGGRLAEFEHSFRGWRWTIDD